MVWQWLFRCKKKKNAALKSLNIFQMTNLEEDRLIFTQKKRKFRNLYRNVKKETQAKFSWKVATYT